MPPGIHRQVHARAQREKAPNDGARRDVRRSATQAIAPRNPPNRSPDAVPRRQSRVADVRQSEGLRITVKVEMFSGIIADIGSIKQAATAMGLRLAITTIALDLSDVKSGDSIAVNGYA